MKNNGFNNVNYFIRVIVLALSTILQLTACDNAVRANKNVTFTINGDPQSVIHPISVKQDSEDVRIQLKQSAPAPDIFSIDAAGNAVAFNYTTEGNSLIVPGKFDHLQLRLKGTEPIDIISEK